MCTILFIYSGGGLGGKQRPHMHIRFRECFTFQMIHCLMVICARILVVHIYQQLFYSKQRYLPSEYILYLFAIVRFVIDTDDDGACVRKIQTENLCARVRQTTRALSFIFINLITKGCESLKRKSYSWCAYRAVGSF